MIAEDRSPTPVCLFSSAEELAASEAAIRLDFPIRRTLLPLDTSPVLCTMIAEDKSLTPVR